MQLNLLIATISHEQFADWRDVDTSNTISLSYLVLLRCLLTGSLRFSSLRFPNWMWYVDLNMVRHNSEIKMNNLHHTFVRADWRTDWGDSDTPHTAPHTHTLAWRLPAPLFEKNRTRITRPNRTPNRTEQNSAEPNRTRSSIILVPPGSFFVFFIFYICQIIGIVSQ